MTTETLPAETITPAAKLPDVPLPAELAELIEEWRETCGDPRAPRTWPELSATHGS